MPDQYGFDHIGPRAGFHRCVECEWPGFGLTVRESERRRHHARHERDRARVIERARRASLSQARQAKRIKAREDRLLGSGATT